MIEIEYAKQSWSQDAPTLNVEVQIVGTVEL